MEEKTLYLLGLINKLKLVERKTISSSSRFESSAEHSWSVAMYAWILYSDFKKEFRDNINETRLIKMALVHDLVEIKSGDTSVWNKENRVESEKRDQKYSDIVFSEFPPELHQEFTELWNELEKNQSLEAKIINGLDRFSGAIQRLVTGQGWIELKATPTDLDIIQLPKIGFSKTLTKLLTELKTTALNQGLMKEKY